MQSSSAWAHARQTQLAHMHPGGVLRVLRQTVYRWRWGETSMRAHTYTHTQILHAHAGTAHICRCIQEHAYKRAARYMPCAMDAGACFPLQTEAHTCASKQIRLAPKMRASDCPSLAPPAASKHEPSLKRQRKSVAVERRVAPSGADALAMAAPGRRPPLARCRRCSGAEPSLRAAQSSAICLHSEPIPAVRRARSSP